MAVELGVGRIHILAGQEVAVKLEVEMGRTFRGLALVTRIPEVPPAGDQVFRHVNGQYLSKRRVQAELGWNQSFA